MKKVKGIFKKNVKLVIGIIIGGVVFGTLGVYAATVLAANQVSYTKNSQSTVDGALDTLFTRANTWIDPNDFGIKRNSLKTIIATPGGVCIKRNGTVYCFGTNNWTYEKDHIQQVFSDSSCYGESDGYMMCNASDFSCSVNDTGSADCFDNSGYSYCEVYSDGRVGCV